MNRKPEQLSAEELARELKLSEDTVRDYATRGIIPALNHEKTRFDWFECVTALRRFASSKVYQHRLR